MKNLTDESKATELKNEICRYFGIMYAEPFGLKVAGEKVTRVKDGILESNKKQLVWELTSY